MITKGVMNRVSARYVPRKGNVASMLVLYNDIKGLTCHQVGLPFYGDDADIMYEFFKNAEIKPNKNVMRYGLEVITDADDDDDEDEQDYEEMVDYNDWYHSHYEDEIKLERMEENE